MLASDTPTLAGVDYIYHRLVVSIFETLAAFGPAKNRPLCQDGETAAMEST